MRWVGLWMALAMMASGKNPLDSHSFSNPQVARVRHADLDLTVDFERKVLRGTATLALVRRTAGPVVLDTWGLKIESVEASRDGRTYRSVGFAVGQPEPYLGAPLTIEAPATARSVRIRYETSPGAQGLQWLDAAQTASKRHPFLFTQSQPHYARTWVPVQDSPGIRMTYAATIRCPKELRAVMSAKQDVGAPLTGEFRFQMDLPVPAYLMALAVGDLVFEPTGPRTGVFAEPATVKAAAAEFSDTEAMVQVVEKLYGPYRWGRYDLLVLPPSFPFGGMENPLVTFATPTVIAGDKSLVSLVAHELAHSWSGNLVTNASWRDFWLNEGFTVYVENRIQEALYGKERADMEFGLEVAGLKRDLTGMKAEDQILHIDLTGRDPEEGMTQVPYIKGALLLKRIEKEVGRAKFDAWLRSYFDRFGFKSITTAMFRADVAQRLQVKGVDLERWIEQPGLPEDAPIVASTKLERVDQQVKRYVSGQAAARDLPWRDWGTQERVRFLEELLPEASAARLDELQAAWDLEANRNAEVRQRWLELAIQADWRTAIPNLEAYLVEIGRRKLVLPLYQALAKTAGGRELARRIYERARPGYHPITQSSVDAVLR